MLKALTNAHKNTKDVFESRPVRHLIRKKLPIRGLFLCLKKINDEYPRSGSTNCMQLGIERSERGESNEPRGISLRNAETIPSGPPLDSKEAPNMGAFFMSQSKIEKLGHLSPCW